jgi:hypothetical protein
VTGSDGNDIRQISFKSAGNQARKSKKPEEILRLFLKDWRLPTLAEAIQPLPSAMQCLTAVFGMGTGRTTAVMPPKSACARPPRLAAQKTLPCIVKDRIRNGSGDSLKTTHRGKKEWSDHNSRVEIAFPKKEKAIKPHDRLVLVN